MANFYRSGFVAADERAKAMQEYFNKLHDTKLTDTQLLRLAKRGNGFLYSILRGTDYFKRLEELNKLIEERKKTKRPLSQSQIACKIIEMQQEYADLAGIFGRPSIKGVERRDGIEDKIKEALSVDLEDDTPDNLEL